ncbi:hypothetical protein [Parabacteroides sp. PF5-6]|uniref:hypothetical protein n=1 Tax=Parabacteroides sp. PF5-6 TaxID=1742403 RepID=UPI002404B401|nr:hypothetical protein [Parabacteroides sp. PF5-6]MDF9830028.1 hypothetical protein [Parabacteroides sp. PF5-6]
MKKIIFVSLFSVIVLCLLSSCDKETHSPEKEIDVAEFIVDTIKISIDDAKMMLSKSVGSYTLSGSCITTKHTKPVISSQEKVNETIHITSDSVTVSRTKFSYLDIFRVVKMNSNYHCYYMIWLHKQEGQTYINGVKSYTESYSSLLVLKENELYQLSHEYIHYIVSYDPVSYKTDRSYKTSLYSKSDPLYLLSDYAIDPGEYPEW